MSDSYLLQKCSFRKYLYGSILPYTKVIPRVALSTSEMLPFIVKSDVLQRSATLGTQADRIQTELLFFIRSRV